MDTSDREIKAIQPLDSLETNGFCEFNLSCISPIRGQHYHNSRRAHRHTTGVYKAVADIAITERKPFPRARSGLAISNFGNSGTSLTFWLCSCIKLSHVTGNSQYLGYKACIRQSAVQGRVQPPVASGWLFTENWNDKTASLWHRISIAKASHE